MNELVDELREKNEDRFGSVALPDLDLLVEIEEQILISLPKELKELLLSVSDVVYGPIEPVTASDPQLHTYLPEVAAVAWDRGVPREFIPICQYQDNFFLVSQEGDVSYWLDGEMHEKEWDSIWNWVDDVWLSGNIPDKTY
tara:strand:- start:334 stop:756 length:423 start_codon:yes stop_codon:yes gene_type:complete